VTTVGDNVALAWAPVCTLARLTPDRGVAALVDGRPIALFRLSSGELFAIGNVDPCSGANVLSRGVVGDLKGAPTVASPMYKQRFDLRTGECLDEPGKQVPVYSVRVVDGMVEVAHPTESGQDQGAYSPVDLAQNARDGG
jgi:nitrite reductase (NADH) small subunit